VLIKTLLVTEAVLTQTPEIKRMLGQSWPLFSKPLQVLIQTLQQSPNPDFTTPLMEALHVGFHSPAEPIVAQILENHRFDYRFITGKPKRFSALKPGKQTPENIQQLWQRAREAGENMQASVEN
jgi:hypothetical protein